MSITKYDLITLKYRNLDGNLITKKLRVVGEGCKIYFNCQHLLLKLGKEARCFFDYLCEKMTSDKNEIILNQQFKNDFIYHIKNITSGKIKPSLSSLNQYVSTFKRLGLIVPTFNTQREFYSVNPRYAFRGSKNARLRLIESMIKERIKGEESLFGLIDKPESELGIISNTNQKK